MVHRSGLPVATHLLLWILVGAGSAAADVVLSDPSSDVYYTLAIVAQKEVKISVDSLVVGDVHSNEKVKVEERTTVDGDVSTSGQADVKGTITGQLEQSAPAKVLPTLMSLAEARALADRVLSGDRDFVDETIDDVIFVDGKVRLFGTIRGRGTIIAASEIVVEKVSPGSGPGLLDPEARLSLIAFKDIKVDENRSLRGALYAAAKVTLEKDVTFEGALVALDQADIKERTRVEFLNLDEVPPNIRALTPADGSFVDADPTGISAGFDDNLSTVDPSTLILVVDDVQVNPDAVSGSGVTHQPTGSLGEGLHRVTVSVSDHAGNTGTATWSFETDTQAPLLSFLEPIDPIRVTDVPEVLFELNFSDLGSGADPSTFSFELNGAVTACELEDFSARCLSPPLATGLHRAVAEISDTLGHRAVASFDLDLTVDLEPPVLTLLTPEDASVVGTTQVPVSGDVSDDGELVSLTVNDVPIALSNGSFETVADVGATGAVVVRAVDSFGRATTESRTLFIDLVEPTLQLLKPVSPALINGETLRVVGRAEDDFALDRVEIDGVLATVGDDGKFETILTIEEGTSVHHARAFDVVGNTAEASFEVTRLDPPEVEILEPADGVSVSEEMVLVTGIVSPDSTPVEVNGVSATVSGGQFSAQIPVGAGTETVTATAFEPGGSAATDTIRLSRDVEAPRVRIYEPRPQTIVTTDRITVVGLVNDIASGTVSGDQVRVEVNGVPAQVSNRSFRVDNVPLALGENLLVAIATDASGNTGQHQARIERIESAGTRHLQIVSGDGQEGVVGAQAPEPLVVEARDATGLPLADIPVLFSVEGGDGKLAEAGRNHLVNTGVDGRAAVSFTLGSRAGAASQKVEAFASGFGSPVVFTVSALAAEPTHIVVDSGDQQVGIAGRELPAPLVAVVTDFGFNRLAGVPVSFEVVQGDGSFPDGSTTTIVETDGDGRAVQSVLVGDDDGLANNVFEARVVNRPEAGIASFTASGRSAGLPEDTAITGVVLDNTNQPVPGATVSVVGTSLATQTDSQGTFRVQPVPVGSVELLVTGQTTTRPGVWPELEFFLTTIPGRDNSVGMPIYLLPLDVDSGLFVDDSHGGTLTLDEVPGFSLEIAPGSVTFPDGSKQGVVSVTPVHSDRVPMVPNFGQQPRFIVTIQPAGAHFDPPAKITYPNVDGLAPGQVTELYSFDHDIGRFVSIGPGTVSPDGSQIVSDEGVGIVKGGWHCGGNPASSGTAHDCPECQQCIDNRCEPDDGAVPQQRPNNCRREICRGGSRASVDDDSDTPLNLKPDDCIQHECQNGRIVLSTDINEIPPQNSGNCKEELCPPPRSQVDTSDTPPNGGCCQDEPFIFDSECCTPTGVHPKIPIEDLDDCPNREPRAGFVPTANGCGSGLFNVPDDPNVCGPSFTPACNAHDKCYGTCLSDRGTCDLLFLADMLLLCETVTNPICKADCDSNALLYAGAVGIVGHLPWKGGQEEACKCCP